MSSSPRTGYVMEPRLKAALLGMIGSFVMFTCYLAIPPIGIFSGILAPFPACYVRLLHGRIPSIVLMLGVTAAVSVLFGVSAGCLYLGMCGIIGVLMPELLLRGFSASRTIFWTTSANLTILAVAVLLYAISTDLNLSQFLNAEITSSVNQALLIYEKAGIKGDDLELIKQTMKMVSDILSLLYPAFITMILITVAGCNLALLKRTVALSDTPLNIAEFRTFRNPDMLVWLLIASGFSLLYPSPHTTAPALNILFIVSLLYFLQGMAVIGTIISRQPMFKIFRVVLYAMLLLQPYLTVVVAAIGLCDLWVDLRTPRPDKQENL